MVSGEGGDVPDGGCQVRVRRTLSAPPVSQIPERFSRIVAMNTALPDGSPEPQTEDGPSGPGWAFTAWRRFSQRVTELDVPGMMKQGVTKRTLTDAEAAAYGAPFPSEEYQTAALLWPRLVPTRPDHPGAYENRLAADRLRSLEIPALLPWADSDPVTSAGVSAMRGILRNCAPPLPIAGAGHFIQEDAGEDVAGHIRRWIEETPAG